MNEVETFKKRCKHVRRADGIQCKKRAMIGLDVCRSHGGALPNMQKTHQLAKLSQGMDKFTEPIPENDPEADVITSFGVEFRRIIGRIRFYDEKLRQLSDEKELIWGKTSEERVVGLDKDLLVDKVTQTYEARANAYLVLQNGERDRLFQMQKLWISAKLDERKLAIMENTVVMLDQVITSIVRGLGKNVNDPDVRNVVRQSMLALPGVDALVGGQ